jgi:uncharacterized protein DUF3606
MSDMSNDQENRGPADRSRVDVSAPGEVKYWRKEFGCTEQQLRQAIAAAGDSAAKVSQYLKSKSTPPKGKAQRYK